MRTEKELLKEVKDLNEVYDGLEVTDEELEMIQCSSHVENCKYAGLSEGHAGQYTYHVKLYGDESIKSIYLMEE